MNWNWKFSGLLVIMLVIAQSFVNIGNNEPVPVDPQQSYIVWKGYKVTGSHHGKVLIKNGDLKFDNGQLIGGSFDIDMNTIACEDLSGEWANKLVNHLKSDDFFGAAKYPMAKFVVTKAISRGTPGSYKIIGNLTIKETTKEIRFNADIKEEGNKKVATADITIDRSEYNVRYGSGSFFDNLGDKTIYDEFDLQVNLVIND